MLSILYMNNLKGMMKKILIILSILLMVVGFFIVRKVYIVNKSKSYNIILISVDTLRADHMGVYGYSKNTTPNIDTWAKDASVFTNTRTVVPYTNPSMTALMTGLHPFSTKITENAIGPFISRETPTIAKTLQKNGYRTTAYVTNRFIGPRLSNQKIGFDEFNFIDAFGNWKEEESRNRYDNFINKAIISLTKNKDKKNFLWIHLMDPHFPYYPPKNLRCNFNKKDCSELQNTPIDIINKTGNKYNQLCLKDPPPQAIADRLESLYDGDIAKADILVGGIIDAIKLNNLEKKSIVIFYGDHGEGFDHNFYFRHGLALYDSSLRIPLIIKHPLLEAKKINLLIDNTDVFPTLLDLLGMSPVKKTLDGKSFLQTLINPFFLNKTLGEGKKYIFATNRLTNKFSIFDGRYKFIYSYLPGCLYKNQREELYDLKKDPGENKNLVNEKIDIAKKFKEILLEQMKKNNLPQFTSKFFYSPEQRQEILNQLKGLGY